MHAGVSDRAGSAHRSRYAAGRVAFQVGNPVGTRDNGLTRLNGQPARSPADALFALPLVEHGARRAAGPDSLGLHRRGLAPPAPCRISSTHYQPSEMMEESTISAVGINRSLRFIPAPRDVGSVEPLRPGGCPTRKPGDSCKVGLRSAMRRLAHRGCVVGHMRRSTTPQIRIPTDIFRQRAENWPVLMAPSCVSVSEGIWLEVNAAI